MSQFTQITGHDSQYICNTYARYPVAIQHGKGSRLWDVDNKEYIDLLSGIAVTCLGHCNDEIADVITQQARKLIHVSNLVFTEEQIVLAQQLLQTCHCHKVFFCNSGAEANEGAIKMARRYQQRVKKTDAFEIISLTGCFHGRTLATVAATGQEKFQDGFSPMPAGFIQVPWGDMQALEQAVSSKTAALIVESVQGEGGIRPLTPEYAKQLADFCHQHKILLIADEIQAGLGRTGKWWGFQHFSLQPDIITSAKGLANGFPMGAILATDEVAQAFTPGTHGTTFGGNPFIAAVASKTLEIIQRDKLASRAALLGEKAIQRFQQLANTLPGTIKEVRGMGLMIGIDLVKPGKEVWEALIKQGFMLNLTQDTVLRLLPALTIDEADLEQFVAALEKTLQQQTK